MFGSSSVTVPFSVSTVLQVLQRPHPSDGAEPVWLQHHSHPQGRQEEEAWAEDRPPGGGRPGAGCAEQRTGGGMAQGKTMNCRTMYFLSYDIDAEKIVPQLRYNSSTRKPAH